MMDTARELKWFDVHLHLQNERLAGNWSALWDRAGALGVQGAVCCGLQPLDWPLVERIGASCRQIIPAYGVHPWQVHQVDDSWLDDLSRRLRGGGCLLGEVGLDGRFARAAMTGQLQALRRQLELARELALPVSLHCLDAWPELLRLLEEFPGLSLAVHAFANPDSLAALRDYGAYFSFNGGLVRSGFGRMKKAVLACPPERLLLETDAPDFPLSGQPVNTPDSLPRIAAAAAGLRNMPLAELAERCWENSGRYLGESLFKRCSVGRD